MPRPGRVRGVVIDSLLGNVLPGARVLLHPGSRAVMTDSVGRFVFDSVPPGEWTLAFQHPALDSIGFVPTPFAIRVFSGASASATLATPSFAPLRTQYCAETKDSLSETLAYGGVRMADSSRTKVDVGVSWVIEGEGARPGSVRTISDPTRQMWIACGIPWGAWIHAFVRDSSRSASAILQMGPRGIAVRDLVLGSGVRTLRGVVVNEDDHPIPGARVTVVGTALAAETDAAGAFVIPGASNGTITVDARAAGFFPTLVTVADGEPAALRVMQVEERTPDAPRGSDYLRLLERSTRPGVALISSQSLEQDPSPLNEIIPSATCRYWMDGRPVAREFFLAQPRRTWRVIEVYVNGSDAPPEYRHAGCTVALLWSAAADW